MHGVNVRSKTTLLGCALAAAIATLPDSAGAQTSTRTYLVTTIAETAAGNVIANEVLSFEGTGDAARLAVTGADGRSVSAPVTFTAQGEIASNSQDAAITCYNMARDVLVRTRQPAGEPASVFVRFGDSVVHIPLLVRAAQTQGDARDIALSGVSTGTFSDGTASVDAGIVINADVAADADDLRAARFEEVHYAGSPQRPIARSLCTLGRAARADVNT
jgi:hypothetical protein